MPLAPYLGGKFRLSKRIIDKIEQIPHTIYAEPFVGMGGIFLRRTQIPKAEVINGELVNLYLIVRRYPDTLYKETEFLFVGRQEFENAAGNADGHRTCRAVPLPAKPSLRRQSDGAVVRRVHRPSGAV